MTQQQTSLLVLNAGAEILPDLSGVTVRLPSLRSFFESSEINTGDMVVTDALVRQLDYPVMAGLAFEAPPDPQAWPIAAPTATVWRGSNYISAEADLGWLVPLLRALPAPIVAIGLGAQAPGAGPMEVPPGTREALRIIADKSVSIGVRGNHSAEILDGIGIRNVRVIGCPSFYRSLRPELAIARPDPEAARLGITLNRSVWGRYASHPIRVRRLQRALLQAAAEREGSVFYAQGEAEEALLAEAVSPEEREALLAVVVKALQADTPAVRDMLRTRTRFFLDPAAWFADVAERIDAMIGFRLHGNVVALSQGIPSVLFTYDSRTREIADLFRLPFIDAGAYEPVCPRRILAEADWSEFEQAYSRNFARYRDFLDENGLAHRLPPAAACHEAAPNGPMPALDCRIDAATRAAWFRDEALRLSGDLAQAYDANAWLGERLRAAPAAQA